MPNKRHEQEKATRQEGQIQPSQIGRVEDIPASVFSRQSHRYDQVLEAAQGLAAGEYFTFGTPARSSGQALKKRLAEYGASIKASTQKDSDGKVTSVQFYVWKPRPTAAK